MNEYILLISPFIAAVIAQITKTLLIRKNKMGLKDFVRASYSGMPSGHSAFVASLLTIIGLTQGLSSPIFALTMVFSFIVISDALKLRRYLGQQGTIINILIRDLKEDQFLDEKYPILKERIGHTKMEVLAGTLLGIAVGILSFLLLGA